MNHLMDASARLEKIRAKQDYIVVSYSGGKDSIVVMDMCRRIFKRVEAFIMVAIPGLPATEVMKSFVRSQWGIELGTFPHWTILQALGAGIYCNPDWPESLEKIKLREVYDAVRNTYACPWIATGYKKADSIWRRRMMAKPSAMAGIVAPLAEWSKRQVLEYLHNRKLPIPDVTSADHNVGAGIDLKTSTLLHLHDHQPEDYAKLREVFPYIDACVKRRDAYGIVA